MPFKFQAFWGSEGYCFLRIIIKDNNLIFFCCQLPDYDGTSVTNAVEIIRATAVKRLYAAHTGSGDKVMEISCKLSFWEKTFKSQKDIDDEVEQEVYRYLAKNSIWIEHYPEGYNLFNNGTYAIVHFSIKGEPTWNYVSKESLGNRLPSVNLEISDEYLLRWKNEVSR